MRCILCNKINPPTMMCMSMSECVCCDCQQEADEVKLKLERHRAWANEPTTKELLQRALEALNKSCTYCENEIYSVLCGACKHGIVIKDLREHLKGGRE